MSMHAYTPVLHTGTDAARAVNRVETEPLGTGEHSGACNLGLLGGRPPGGTHIRQNASRKTAPAVPTRADDIGTPCIAYLGPFMRSAMRRAVLSLTREPSPARVEREAAHPW
jgi:hypothetical protein